MNDPKHRTRRSHSHSPIDAECHALKIAVDVAEAWHKGSGPARPEVALGVVATIAMAGMNAQRGPELAQVLRDQSPEEFVAMARYTWAVTLHLRPDLAAWVHPLLTWLFDDTDQQLRARIKRIADAALDASQLDLIATDRRYTADLLGPVLGALRAPANAKVNAQMYTPGDVARALTALALDDIRPGQSFCDDTVGTGGLFRVAAETIRGRGLDPADMIWFGADIDELAVAATAVNSLIWQLGPRIVLYIGDILTQPDWAAEAQRRRAHFLERVDGLFAAAGALDFLKRL
ncbi:N-6 DNA methylase [Amycolatopsis sp. RTGN1]|uniref:N-6 DNA methylase n=1 Tax=Amycolatopsis ponsaeliensis TaxID=2992142 RepID=UPI00254BCC17|nr:N-6 DNA methylase [Amycolatopsis sp. RTGN1]